MKSAIIYIRVSSDDQVQGTSLGMQETECRRWCEREGHDIAAIFRDEGESAKTRDRPQLLAALEFARKQKPTIFLVWKIDRLARNQLDFHSIRAVLMNHGTKVVSVTEYLTDDPSGRLMEGILSAFAQFDNEVRGERSRRGMAEQARDGYWCWQAPIGYENMRTEDGRPTLQQDPVGSDIIRRAFGMIASGQTQAAVVRLFHHEDFRGRQGGRITAQGLQKILRNPVYAGLLSSSLIGPEPIRGRWEPIISLETFSDVQRHLNGTSIWERKDRREEFPLRGWILCHACRNPLTASWSTGRHGTKYGYYRCHRCGKVNARKERVEEEFVELLDLIRFSQDEINAHRGVVKDVWEDQGRAAQGKFMARRRLLEQLKKRKARLIDLLVDGAIDKEEYDVRVEKIGLEMQLASSGEEYASQKMIDIEAAIEASCQLLENPARAWKDAQGEVKYQIQVLIFPEAPTWRGDTFGTIVINKAIEYLRPDGPVDYDLVTHVVNSWKLIVAFIQSAQIIIGAA